MAELPTMGDPAALWRDMLGQWEKVSNEWGGKLMQSSEFAQGMQGMTALSLKLQQGSHEAMQKMLTAANLPSRADLLELGAQVRGVEERLGRIEAALATIGAAAPAPERPKPARTRQPAAKPTA